METPSISGLYELVIAATAEYESVLIQYWQQFGFTVGESGTLNAIQANQLYGINSSLRSGTCCPRKNSAKFSKLRRFEI